MTERRVVVLCIDGFDPEYLEACEMPNICEIAKKGFLKIGKCMMPSVTNVNNVSLVTASYPRDHGICSNYLLNREKNEGLYLESGEYIRRETIFQKARRQGRVSVLATSKDKLRTLLNDNVTFSVSAEHPPKWIQEKIGKPPEIYSLEINGWTIRAAGHMMSRGPADIVYITTTDYAMHTYPPDAPESQQHMTILDNAIGDLLEAHPDITLFITADHGMSKKNKMVDIRHALLSYGINSNPVPIIKDRYVVHHANLGGSMYVYVNPRYTQKTIEILQATSGVEEALTREEAAVKFKLCPERIGDVVVTGEKHVVFGDPTEIEMPDNLRSHGSVHECRIPIIGYNGDFKSFRFRENRDVGRYIFEKVLGKQR